MSPHCNLDLEDSKDVSFQLTLQFMMMHHDTKFGYERFNCSEDTVMPIIKQHYDFRYCLSYCLLTFAPSASLTDRYMDSQAETDCKNTIFMLQFCPAGTIKSVLAGQQANNEYPETSRDLSCLYLKVEIQSPEQRTVASNLMPQSSFTCCTYTMNSACVRESVCRHNHTCTN